ncbi:hypothetical protein BCV72DRAFT_315368, partial [Rhizopus microsporus var. microsporus]
TEASNYCPISLTLDIRKLFKKCLQPKMQDSFSYFDMIEVEASHPTKHIGSRSSFATTLIPSPTCPQAVDIHVLRCNSRLWLC